MLKTRLYKKYMDDPQMLEFDENDRRRVNIYTRLFESDAIKLYYGGFPDILPDYEHYTKRCFFQSLREHIMTSTPLSDEETAMLDVIMSFEAKYPVVLQQLYQYIWLPSHVKFHANPLCLRFQKTKSIEM